MRFHQQVPCVILSLTGEVEVHFRYPSDNGAHLGETDYWLSRMQRIMPEHALFISDECRYKGAFASMADACAKLKAARYSSRSQT